MENLISATDMSRSLNISRNTLNTFMYQAVPDEWSFKKKYTKTYPRGYFQFTEKDYKLFYRIREYKKTMTYKQVKELLAEEMTKMSTDDKQHPFQHLLDFIRKVNEDTGEEVKKEIKPSISLIKLENKQGQLLVSSREVAENFGKEHRNILRDINNLISSNLSVSKMFLDSSYKDNMNRVQSEYLLTRDGFSLLVMGFTGNKALQWKLKYIEAFNQMEKELQSRMIVKESYTISDPIERAKAWILEQQEVKALKLTTTKQEQIIGELKPRADYTDIILQSKDLITITQISKDYGMSGQAMNKLLFDLGVQYKQSGQWLLYKEHQGKGYTHSETTQYVKYNGEIGSNMLTKWTQKGRLFLYELLKQNEVLPDIEKVG